MFPFLTRIFWLLLQPLSIVVMLLLAALLLSWLGLRWPTRLLAGLALLLLFVCSFTTFGHLLIAPLEARFVRPAEPARVDGIVVLGGGMDAEVNTARGGFELNRSGDRYVEALRLALAHPEARIVVAAGPGPYVDLEPEAAAAQRFFTAFGIVPERLALDDKSRNTKENARYAHEIAGPADGQTWLLVTSAFHMPRAVGLFRRVGFPVVPWPTDYFTSGRESIGIELQSTTENLAVTHLAIREWTALATYYLAGRIDQFVPGP